MTTAPVWAEPNVFGEINFHRGGESWSGFATVRWLDDRCFAGWADGHETWQIGRVDIDLAAGTLRGINSVEQLVGLYAQTSTTAWAFPSVQAVALDPAAPPGPVLLDVRVALDGYFEVYVRTEMNTSAYHQFTATLGLHFPGVTATRAQATYAHDWQRTYTVDDARHQKSASAANCAGCFAEVILRDPQDEFRSGFNDITLRTTISLESGVLIVPDLFIRGRSIASSHGAHGDWSNAARFGYVLPAGHALATADGVLLDAWNLQPVPEPRTAALFARGLGVLAAGWRRRAAQD